MAGGEKVLDDDRIRTNFDSQVTLVGSSTYKADILQSNSGPEQDLTAIRSSLVNIVDTKARFEIIDVKSLPTRKTVITRPADQRVVAAPGEKSIIAAQARQCFCQSGADQSAIVTC